MTVMRTSTKAIAIVAGLGMAASMALASLGVPAQEANAVPSYSQLSESKAKQKSLESQLSGVSSDLAQKIIELDDLTNNQIPAAIEAADNAANAAEAAQGEADAAASRLEAAQKDKADLEEKIQQTGEDYDDAHAAVAQLARDSFHGSAASDTMSVVTGAKSTDDFIKTMQSDAAVTRSESNAANEAATTKNTQMNRKDRLDAIEKQITTLKTAAETKAAEAKQTAADAQAKTASLNDLRNKGDQQRAELESRQSELKTAAAQQAAQTVMIQSQIDSYNQQIAAQQAAAKQNAQQQINGNSGGQGTTRPSSGSSSSGGSSSRPSSGGSSSGGSSSGGSSNRPSSGGSSSGGSSSSGASGMNYSVPGNCAAGSSFCYGHNTGNVGNVYEYSQCTWWAYVRRSQLQLPVGSYMGNGQDWGNSGRRLGYLVNTTPHVGAAISFRAGQNGSSAVYGHVAIVEQVRSDGSIVTSNCGKSMNGKIYYQTIPNAASGAYTYVHY